MLQIIFVAFIFLGFPQLSSSVPCTYATCVYQGHGHRVSPIDEHFVQMKFRQIPSNASTMCELLLARERLCRGQWFTSCPSVVAGPYASRLSDNYFMHYVMELGKQVCEHLDSYLEIKTCLTADTQRSLRSCFVNHGYSMSCLRSKYSLFDSCLVAKQRFASLVNNFYDRNPYGTSP